VPPFAGIAATGFNGDNQPATSASFNEPSGTAVDAAGNIYVADTNNNRIRKFTIVGNITTVAGTGNYGQPVNGAATLNYAGLAPGVVGLYQFNITVPDAPDGDYPVTFQAGAVKTSQAVYVTVKR
jgi:hypothetical protein